MKTSAPPASEALAAMEMTGVLVANAHTAVRILDGEGHSVPVLVMDIELDSLAHNRAHLEQPFPMGQQAQCEAAARRYRRGTRITWQAPILDARLVVPNVSHIFVHNPESSE